MWSDQRLEVGRGSSIDHLVGQYPHLVSDASEYREPVEVPEEGGPWESFGRLNTRRAALFWRRCTALGGTETEQQRVGDGY